MYASANLGDTAIQSVVMSALRSRRPDVEFIGLCSNPEDTARTHRIPAFPASGRGVLVTPEGIATPDRGSIAASEPAFLGRIRALRNIDRQVRALDMLLVSGGGQIDDFWGGPWHQPFRLFAWCCCARLHRKPIGAFAVGVDDLRRRLSAWFATHALDMAQYRTFRDAGSLEALRKRGLHAFAGVCPDPAFGLLPPAHDVESRAGQSKFVVISPISNHAFSVPSEAEYDKYLSALANLADTLVEQGIRVRFVCSQTRMDPPVALGVQARMKTSAGVTTASISTVDDFVLAVTGAELVIASRLHALILSLVAGTPIVAISPARKVRQQMVDIGLADYCVDLASLRAPELLSRVQAALEMRLELSALVHRRVGELRRDLDEAFDQLASVLPS